MTAVVHCRINAGNTTSPGSDNTFTIVIPPGMTPIGEVRPKPGSPPGKAC
jgi:hypothetical protein